MRKWKKKINKNYYKYNTKLFLSFFSSAGIYFFETGPKETVNFFFLFTRGKHEV